MKSPFFFLFFSSSKSLFKWYDLTFFKNITYPCIHLFLFCLNTSKVQKTITLKIRRVGEQKKKGGGELGGISRASGVGKVEYDGWIGGLETDCTRRRVDECCISVCHQAITWRMRDRTTERSKNVKVQRSRHISRMNNQMFDMIYTRYLYYYKWRRCLFCFFPPWHAVPCEACETMKGHNDQTHFIYSFIFNNFYPGHGCYRLNYLFLLINY